MLLFSSLLNVRNLTKEQFVNLIIEWNQGSPHMENIISGLTWDGTPEERHGNDKVWMEFIDFAEKKIMAVRYEKAEDEGVIWDTDYVFNYKEMKICIRLDRSYKEEALVTNAEFSTPQFIQLLINNGYIQDDGNIEVSVYPHRLKRNNIDLLTDLINGRAKYNLPIVYVSKTKENREPFDTQKLSYRLKGIAHVVLQDNSSLNHIIGKKCNKKNEEWGTVGVYYPNEKLGHKKCKYKEGHANTDFFMDKIIGYVIQFSNLQAVNPLYTWHGVKNEILNQLIVRKNEECKNAINDRLNAKNEVDSIYAEFSNEIDELERKVKELTNRNAILENENNRLSMNILDNSKEGIVYQLNEKDLFPGEINEIVLSILQESLENAKSGTRRYDVVKDIIDSNQSSGVLQRKAVEVKRVLKGYKSLNATKKKALEDIGLFFKDEGKHYKAVYYNDNRYMVTIAKTPSDARSGNNVSSTIIREWL